MQHIQKLKLSVSLFIALLSFQSHAQKNEQPEWKGTITKNAAEAGPYHVESNKKATPGSPNIVLILLDDVGFGATSAFGGLINTPTLDNLANNGLRYTNFHTAGICSPTRSALLTGRNHHAVSMGMFPPPYISGDFPGYNGHTSP